jgi:hypothetical protein
VCAEDGTEIAFVKANDTGESLLYALLVRDDAGRWWLANALRQFGPHASWASLVPEIAKYIAGELGQLDEAVKEGPVLPPSGERNVVEAGGSMSLAEACELVGVATPANMDICLGRSQCSRQP